MFDLTNPELVAAVSNAGGLGVLAMTDISQVEEVKTLTDKPFAVNTYATDDETVAALKDAGINIIFVGALQHPGTDWAIDTSAIEFRKEQGFIFSQHHT